jgi:hypothetical protein
MVLSAYDRSADAIISGAVTIYPSDTSISVRLNTKLGNFAPGTYEMEISSGYRSIVSDGQLLDVYLNYTNEQPTEFRGYILSDFWEEHHWLLSSKTGGILEDCWVSSFVDIFSTEYETSNFLSVSFADNEIPTFNTLQGVELSANGSSTGYDATVSNDTLANVRISYDYASHIVQVSGTYSGREWGREYLVVRDTHDWWYGYDPGKDGIYAIQPGILTDDTAYTTLDGNPKETYTLSIGESDNVNYLLTVKKDDGSLSIRIPETDATGKRLNEFILKTDIKYGKSESSSETLLQAANENEMNQNAEDDNQKVELKFLDEVKFEGENSETISVDADGVSLLRFM